MIFKYKKDLKRRDQHLTHKEINNPAWSTLK